jgi:hypothetical protein
MLSIFAEWSSAGAALLLFVCGLFINSHRGRLERMDKKYEDLHTAHAALRLAVVGEYAKKQEMEQLRSDFKQECQQIRQDFREDVRECMARFETSVTASITSLANRLPK